MERLFALFQAFVRVHPEIDKETAFLCLNEDGSGWIGDGAGTEPIEFGSVADGCAGILDAMERRSNVSRENCRKAHRVALMRVIQLARMMARQGLAPDEREEYAELYQWCVDTLNAGVASRQESFLEH